MSKIAVVYHSGFGHTEKLAESIIQGAKLVSEVSVKPIKTAEALEDLNQFADYKALIFGSPTYMGSVSAEFKKFMDATTGIWLERKWKHKLAAGFTNSLNMSGDKLSTLYNLMTFSCQHGMIWVPQMELNSSNTPGKSGEYDKINRVGSSVGLMAQSDNLPPEEAPSKGDLETAKLFGNSIAKISVSFKL